MSIQRSFNLALVLSVLLPWVARAGLHHDLEVNLNPSTAAIEVRDTVTLPEDYPASLTFSLHPALQVRLLDENARLSEITADSTGERQW